MTSHEYVVRDLDKTNHLMRDPKTGEVGHPTKGAAQATREYWLEAYPSKESRYSIRARKVEK